MTSGVPIEVYAVNNCSDDMPVDFIRMAQEEAEKRRQRGYDTDGNINGQYNETSPPPGMRFGGYLKGCMGVVWKPENEAPEPEERPGYCSFCGHSLYHYAGMKCGRQNGVDHPLWCGDPPPSFDTINNDF